MNLAVKKTKTIDRGDTVIYKRLPYTVTTKLFKTGKYKYNLLSLDGKISLNNIKGSEIYLSLDKYYSNGLPVDNKDIPTPPPETPYVTRIRDIVTKRNQNYYVGYPILTNRYTIFKMNYGMEISPYPLDSLTLVDRRELKARSYYTHRLIKNEAEANYEILCLSWYNYYLKLIYDEITIPEGLSGYHTYLHILLQLYKAPITSDNLASILTTLFDGLTAVTTVNSVKIYNDKDILLFEQYDRINDPTRLKIYSQNGYNGQPMSIQGCSGWINNYVPDLGVKTFSLTNNYALLSSLTVGDESSSAQNSLLRICELYGIELKFKYDPAS